MELLINCFATVCIPRCYFTATPVEIQIHAFSDASEHAYTTVVFLQSCYQDGPIHVRLAASKNKVAPMTKQSIPCLELLGASSLGRLVDKFKVSIGEIHKIIYWTDSMTTLCWMKNKRVWKKYVQHRVDEIRNLTFKDSWQHCPGHLNPADLPLHGLTSNALIACKTWWKGLKFLYLPESKWPENRATQSEDKVALKEVVMKPTAIVHSLVNTLVSMSEKKIDQTTDINLFHDLMKLLHVTALVVKAVKFFKSQVTKKKNTEKERMRLNAADLKETEQLWIRSVQGSAFSKEITFLLSKVHSSAFPAYVTQFGLFLDNGIIKCEGRLNNATLPVNTRNPILQPAKHEFTCLLIKQSHESVKHSGIGDTLTTIRERYWVLHGREAVRKFVRGCVICCKHEGTPYCPLPPADLPSNRISEDPPFTHIGLDFAGLLYVELRIQKTKSRNHRKSTFASSCAHPPKLYIWNLHEPLVLNRSYLHSEDSLVEEDYWLPSLLTTPRHSDLHLKTYEK